MSCVLCTIFLQLASEWFCAYFYHWSHGGLFIAAPFRAWFFASKPIPFSHSSFASLNLRKTSCRWFFKFWHHHLKQWKHPVHFRFTQSCADSTRHGSASQESARDILATIGNEGSCLQYLFLLPNVLQSWPSSPNILWMRLLWHQRTKNTWRKSRLLLCAEYYWNIICVLILCNRTDLLSHVLTRKGGCAFDIGLYKEWPSLICLQAQALWTPISYGLFHQLNLLRNAARACTLIDFCSATLRVGWALKTIRLLGNRFANSIFQG